MDKYLKQLLEKYAKVILPSFGAIVVENEETGNLMFNEYLSYNDGKLDDLIVSESNMELQEAQNMIAKYIRDIQVQIDKGESYDIFELGRFYKNDDGDIEFEGNLKEGPKKQSKSNSSKKVAVLKDSDSGKKKEETPKAKEEKKESKPEPKKEEPTKEKKVDSKAKKDTKSDSQSTPKENKFVAKEETNVDKEKSTSAENKKEENKANTDNLKADAKEKKEEAKANKAKLKADKKAKASSKAKASESAKDPNKKKRFGAIFWILIVVLGLASAGLIYVGLNYDKVKSYMGWDEFEGKENIASKEIQDKTEKTNSKDNEPESINEDVVADTTEVSNVEFDEEGNVAEENNESQDTETEVEPEPEPEIVKTASNGTHHLIAGSFSKKSNAEDLVKELKGKGLNARILGQFGGLHFVAAASYNSSKAARDDIERIKQHASGAWIFKYNDN